MHSAKRIRSPARRAGKHGGLAAGMLFIVGIVLFAGLTSDHLRRSAVYHGHGRTHYRTTQCSPRVGPPPSRTLEKLEETRRGVGATLSPGTKLCPPAVLAGKMSAIADGRQARKVPRGGESG